ncbi:hypothetical protein JHK87_003071 [Glycine soja]|nr:hypothetical protein JHK87_003071 [Glycine soja]
MYEAVGAGLTGSKMARRVGGVDEFEFKAIGENHNQGEKPEEEGVFSKQVEAIISVNQKLSYGGGYCLGLL